MSVLNSAHSLRYQADQEILIAHLQELKAKHRPRWNLFCESIVACPAAAEVTFSFNFTTLGSSILL